MQLLCVCTFLSSKERVQCLKVFLRNGGRCLILLNIIILGGLPQIRFLIYSFWVTFSNRGGFFYRNIPSLGRGHK